MNKTEKIIYIIDACLFIVGLSTTLSWSYSGRLFGLILLVISISSGFYLYRKTHRDLKSSEIDLKQASLGGLLILIDISYNVIMNDPIRYFDYGMLISGILIILLNINLLNFLKLDKKMIDFTSYFIFIILVLYGFLFKGLDILLGVSGDSNPLWEWFNKNVVYISSPFLNLIRPTTINGNTINFDGLSIGIGYACSGIESLSVFFAAVIAYFIAQKERNLLKAVKYILIGGAALYAINILRVIIIILVGYYYGVESLMFVHANLGWIFFVAGMSVFWYLVIKDF